VPSYTTQTGRYTRVGNTVTFQALIVTSSTALVTPGNLRISLPVTSTVTNSQALTIGRITSTAGVSLVSATAITSGAFAYGNVFHRTAASQGDTQTTIGNISGAFTLYYSGVYFV